MGSESIDTEVYADYMETRAAQSTLTPLRFLLVLLTGLLPFVCASPAFAQEQDPLLRARQWLQDQVVSQKSGSLIRSYSGTRGPRCYVYDQALAIIAFTMLTDYDRATGLIRGLMALVKEDGSLLFSYSVHNPQDEGNAMVRTGAMGWVGYAVCFYLDVSGDKTNYEDFLGFAKHVAQYVQGKQIRKKGDPRDGLVTGGDATIRLEASAETGEVEEVYVPGPITWCSVEHNIDTYFFFTLLGGLTRDSSYMGFAYNLKTNLLKKCWDEELGQFMRGVNLEEGDDKVLALDCASWGGLLLASVGEHEKLAASQAALQKYYYNEVDGLQGYKAYYDKLIYENYLVGKAMYPDQPKKTWKSLEAVWPEGTMGVATLYLKVGRTDDAGNLFRTVERMQDTYGGIPYHSMVIPFEFETSPSVASTAWYLMNRMMDKDERLLKKFWE